MEIDKLQQSLKLSPSTSISKSTYDKIVAENDRLVKEYKKEMAKTEKLQLALSTLQVQHDKLTKDVEQFNKSAPSSKPTHLSLSASPRVSSPGQQHGSVGGREDLEVRVEQLQAELEKKTTMLMEVKKHLKEAAEREKQLKSLSSDAQVA